MTLYDISGNEIHGKEVVFERYVTTDRGIVKAESSPYAYKKLIYLGCYELEPDVAVFMLDVPMHEGIRIYLGQLKDKI